MIECNERSYLSITRSSSSSGSPLPDEYYTHMAPHVTKVQVRRWRVCACMCACVRACVCAYTPTAHRPHTEPQSNDWSRSRSSPRSILPLLRRVQCAAQGGGSAPCMPPALHACPMCMVAPHAAQCPRNPRTHARVSTPHARSTPTRSPDRDAPCVVPMHHNTRPTCLHRRP
jgi:hypothetical protein